MRLTPRKLSYYYQNGWDLGIIQVHEPLSESNFAVQSLLEILWSLECEVALCNRLMVTTKMLAARFNRKYP